MCDRNVIGDVSTDPFVEIFSYNTQTCRESFLLFPVIYVPMEVLDDTIFQDEQWELRLLDQDLYTSETSIGTALFDLNSVFVRNAVHRFPLFSSVSYSYGLFNYFSNYFNFICVIFNLLCQP